MKTKNNIKTLKLKSIEDLKKINFNKEPYACLIIALKKTDKDFKEKVSNFLINSNCLYTLSAGQETNEWHNEVDLAEYNKYKHKFYPEESHVMTSEHRNEEIEETVYFLFNITTYGYISDPFKNYLLLFIGENEEIEKRYLFNIKRYENYDVSPDNPDEFFKWFKKESEKLTGYRWKPGLTDKEIKDFEKNLGFEFPEIYKIFLKNMNGLYYPSSNGYYSYPDDLKRMKEMINWICESFNIKPEDIDKKGIPHILPITAHRCLIVDRDGKNPVLSMYGDDVIPYNTSLQNFLINDIFFKAKQNVDLNTHVDFWLEDEDTKSKISEEIKTLKEFEDIRDKYMTKYPPAKYEGGGRDGWPIDFESYLWNEEIAEWKARVTDDDKCWIIVEGVLNKKISDSEAIEKIKKAWDNIKFTSVDAMDCVSHYYINNEEDKIGFYVLNIFGYYLTGKIILYKYGKK